MILSSYYEMLNRIGLRVVTEPVTEQITLQQAYDHLRLDAYGSPPARDDDDLINAYISAAREWCEGWSGRALAPQVLELSLSGFPDSYLGSCWPSQTWPCYSSYSSVTGSVALPMSPLLGIESVTYTDSEGVIQTMSPADYILDNRSEPGWLYPAYSTSWPSTRTSANALTIRYHAGYTTPGDSPDDYPLPKRYFAAMLLVLGHLYENRENSTIQYKVEDISLGAAALMERGRIRLSMA